MNEQEGQTRYWEAALVLALVLMRIPYWYLDTPWVSMRWRFICLVRTEQFLNGQYNAFLKKKKPSVKKTRGISNDKSWDGKCFGIGDVNSNGKWDLPLVNPLPWVGVGHSYLTSVATDQPISVVERKMYTLTTIDTFTKENREWKVSWYMYLPRLRLLLFTSPPTPPLLGAIRLRVWFWVSCLAVTALTRSIKEQKMTVSGIPQEIFHWNKDWYIYLKSSYLFLGVLATLGTGAFFLIFLTFLSSPLKT